MPNNLPRLFLIPILRDRLKIELMNRPAWKRRNSAVRQDSSAARTASVDRPLGTSRLFKRREPVNVECPPEPPHLRSPGGTSLRGVLSWGRTATPNQTLHPTRPALALPGIMGLTNGGPVR